MVSTAIPYMACPSKSSQISPSQCTHNFLLKCDNAHKHTPHITNPWKEVCGELLFHVSAICACFITATLHIRKKEYMKQFLYAKLAQLTIHASLWKGINLFSLLSQSCTSCKLESKKYRLPNACELQITTINYHTIKQHRND